MTDRTSETCGAPTDATCAAVAGSGPARGGVLLEVRVAQAGPPNVRRKCCANCACRPSSPLAHEALTEVILEDAESGAPFNCHKGVDGRVEPDCADWTMRADGVALRPDGAPADLCAGWWAYRTAHLRGVEL